MKNQLRTIISVTICIVVFNLPLFLLLQRNYTSIEQPDYSATFESRLAIANQNFTPQKQLLTASHNNFAGISVLVFNSSFWERQTVTLRLFDPENLSEPLIEKEYSVAPTFLFGSIPLLFESLPDSQNKSFIVLVAPHTASENKINKTLKNDVWALNARPLYKDSGIEKTLYDRVSQYKPLFLKAPWLIGFYMLFNVLLATFLFRVSIALSKK